MNNRKLISIIFSLLLTTYSLQGQVTIGAGTQPDIYSILQVEHSGEFPYGGIQIPRLDTKELTALTIRITTHQEREKAIGLMIYDKALNKIVYWNGEEWIPIPAEIVPNFTAENGLKHQKLPNSDITVVGLGGNLIEHTNIPIEDKSLKFVQQGTGELALNSGTNNLLTIKENKVGINTASPEALLHLKKADNKEVLRYADGSQGTRKVLTVLDADGTVTWKDLPAQVKMDGIEVNTGNRITIGNTTNYEITNSSNRITCGKGKWLIMAKASTWTLKRNSSGVIDWNGSALTPDYDYKYTWLKVKDSGGNILAVSGDVTEKGGYRIGLPVLSFYYEFPEETTLSLYVQGKAAISTLEAWPMGAPTRIWYFYALRLSGED